MEVTPAFWSRMWSNSALKKISNAQFTCKTLSTLGMQPMLRIQIETHSTLLCSTCKMTPQKSWSMKTFQQESMQDPLSSHLTLLLNLSASSQHHLRQHKRYRSLSKLKLSLVIHLTRAHIFLLNLQKICTNQYFHSKETQKSLWTKRSPLSDWSRRWIEIRTCRSKGSTLICQTTLKVSPWQSNSLALRIQTLSMKRTSEVLSKFKCWEVAWNGLKSELGLSHCLRWIFHLTSSLNCHYSQQSLGNGSQLS